MLSNQKGIEVISIEPFHPFSESYGGGYHTFVIKYRYIKSGNEDCMILRAKDELDALMRFHKEPRRYDLTQ